MKTMQKTLIATFALALGTAAPAQALEIWHSNTVWAGQGQCSAVFGLDSMEAIEKLEISITVVDAKGKKVASGTITTEGFGGTSADRYAESFIEGEAFCADNLTLIVKKATANIEGVRTDLLKTQALAVRAFKPFPIRLGK